jgi:hypothetical protein
MDNTLNIIRWSARGLGILFALFISLFALDVFTEYTAAADIAKALLIHLIPTFVVLIVLVLAWRWELIGAIAFTLLGLAYIVTSLGRFPFSTYLLIAGPPIVIGMLFFTANRLSSSGKFE